MLPVVAGVESTRRQIFLYSLPMAAAAVAPWPLGLAGAVYGDCGGGIELRLSRARGAGGGEPRHRAGGDGRRKALFAYSVFYLFALFAVLVADRFLAW